MCAYNAVDGEPACASEELLTRHAAPALGLQRLCRLRLRRGRRHLSRRSARLHRDARRGRGRGVQGRHGPDLRRRSRDRPYPQRGAHGRARPRPSIDRALVPPVHRAHAARPVRSERAQVFPSITARRLRHRRDTARCRCATAEQSAGAAQERERPAAAAQPRRADRGDRPERRQSRRAGRATTTASRRIRSRCSTGIRRRFPDAQVTYAARIRTDRSGAGSGARRRLLRRRTTAAGTASTAEYFDEPGHSGAARASNARVANAASRVARASAQRSRPLDRLPHGARERRIHVPLRRQWRLSHLDRRQADRRRLGGRLAPVDRHRHVTLEAGRTYPIRVEAFQRTDAGRRAPAVEPCPATRASHEAVAAARDADLVGLRRRAARAGRRRGNAGRGRRLRGGDRTSLDLPAPQQAIAGTGRGDRHAGRAGADERQRAERELGRRARARRSSRPGIRAGRAAMRWRARSRAISARRAGCR